MIIPGKQRRYERSVVVRLMVAATAIMLAVCSGLSCSHNHGAADGNTGSSNQPSEDEVARQVSDWYTHKAAAELLGVALPSPTTMADLLSVKVKEAKRIDSSNAEFSCEMTFKMKATYQGGDDTPAVLLVGFGFENSPSKTGDVKTLQVTFPFAKMDGAWVATVV